MGDHSLSLSSDTKGLLAVHKAGRAGYTKSPRAGSEAKTSLKVPIGSTYS